MHSGFIINKFVLQLDVCQSNWNSAKQLALFLNLHWYVCTEHVIISFVSPCMCLLSFNSIVCMCSQRWSTIARDFTYKQCGGGSDSIQIPRTASNWLNYTKAHFQLTYAWFALMRSHFDLLKVQKPNVWAGRWEGARFDQIIFEPLIKI